MRRIGPALSAQEYAVRHIEALPRWDGFGTPGSPAKARLRPTLGDDQDSRQSIPVFPLSRDGPARSSPTAGNADRAAL